MSGAQREKKMETEPVSFRMPKELLQQVKDYAQDLQVEVRKSAPGVSITVTDAVVALLSEGLESKKAKAKRKGGR